MKKLISCILALLLVAVLACAGAEEKTDTFFTRLEGLEWTFSSGAGGWSTDMRILPDGTFSGEYHDSEMGEATAWQIMLNGDEETITPATENPFVLTGLDADSTYTVQVRANCGDGRVMRRFVPEKGLFGARWAIFGEKAVNFGIH